MEWEEVVFDKKASLSPPQIFNQANTPLKRWLLNFAAKRKGAEVSSGIIRSDSIWDKIFFSKIQVIKCFLCPTSSMEKKYNQISYHYRLN